MKFKPLSDTELKDLLPKGDYEFKVEKAVEGVSSKGNHMITLSLKVFKPKSGYVYVKDWLLSPEDESDPDKIKKKTWKLKSFCKAVGLLESYEQGTLSEADCINKKGLLHINLNKNDRGEDVNNVARYLEHSAAPIFNEKTQELLSTLPSSKFKQEETFNDDIPF